MLFFIFQTTERSKNQKASEYFRINIHSLEIRPDPPPAKFQRH